MTLQKHHKHRPKQSRWTVSGDTGKITARHRAGTKRKLNATTNSDGPVNRLYKVALLRIKAEHKVLTRGVKGSGLAMMHLLDCKT